MSCEHCTLPDGGCAFPYYGSAPHSSFHKTDDGRLLIRSDYAPREEWPENFIPEDGGPCGVYAYCPECKEGKLE